MEITHKRKGSVNVVMLFLLAAFTFLGFILGAGMTGGSNNASQQTQASSNNSSIPTSSSPGLKVEVCDLTQFANDVSCNAHRCPTGYAGFYPDCTVSKPAISTMNCSSSGGSMQSCTAYYSDGTSQMLSCSMLNNSMSCTGI